MKRGDRGLEDVGYREIRGLLGLDLAELQFRRENSTFMTVEEVNILMACELAELYGQDTQDLRPVWMVEEEAYASREAWARSIGLSQATHQELQTHRDHVYAHETYLQAHQTQLQLQSTLIQTQHQRLSVSAEKSDGGEMSDMQAELLALREQRRRARQPGPEARIPDHQEASGDADSDCLDLVEWSVKTFGPEGQQVPYGGPCPVLQLQIFTIMARAPRSATSRKKIGALWLAIAGNAKGWGFAVGNAGRGGEMHQGTLMQMSSLIGNQFDWGRKGRRERFFQFDKAEVAWCVVVNADDEKVIATLLDVLKVFTKKNYTTTIYELDRYDPKGNNPRKRLEPRADGTLCLTAGVGYLAMMIVSKSSLVTDISNETLRIIQKLMASAMRDHSNSRGLYQLAYKAAPIMRCYGRNVDHKCVWPRLGKGPTDWSEINPRKPEKIVLIKQGIAHIMHAGTDRQKSYADRKRKPMEFRLGTELCSKSHLGKESYGSGGMRGKLNPRYVDFKVLRLRVEGCLQAYGTSSRVSRRNSCDDKLLFVEESLFEIMDKGDQTIEDGAGPL
ncbi:hypothetical protein Tco_0969365 [Tanacetum coccineum]